MNISPVSLCVRLKFLFLEHFQPAISTVYGSLFFSFRLNSSIRNKTGTHVFWENGVDYPRVSPGAHPLTKKPEDSGYEIGTLLAIPVTLAQPKQCFVCAKFAQNKGKTLCSLLVFT